MILNTDAGVTHKGSCHIFPVFPMGVSVWVIQHTIGLYWLHWTRRIDRDGNLCETVAPADERKEVDEQKWRQWRLLTQSSALTTFALLSDWKSANVRNVDLDLDSPYWGLWSVSSCQGVEPSPVPEINTHPLIFFDLKHLSVARLPHTWRLNRGSFNCT